MKLFFKLNKNSLTLIVALVFMSVIKTEAQQYPVYSQYIFNPLVINPAVAGSHVQVSATAMYRNQWVNFDGAPKTFSFSGHTSLLKNKIGVGLLVANDQIGSYNNNSVFGSYAFIIRSAMGTFSMGLQAGFNLTSADFSSLNLKDPNDPSFAAFDNKFKPNFGAGVYYSNDLFFAGLSVPFILTNSVDITDAEALANGVKEARYYYFHGGMTLPLSRMKTVVFNPTVLLRGQEGQPLSMDLNAGFIFYDVFSVGASYRNVDAIVTYIQLKITESLNFGYSYDWTSSDMKQYSSGSHEFSLNYRFRIRKIHGNVECPSVFKF
ncbi:PorP/SprF family type IX secretion system membrane protein [Fulvivirga sediminis]|uniref:Type IX secretion system membrane protein PorP/SprF n=1 Tax=Fulvivirga sediminis TaxID=2803949 RepID=A0A937FB29_9BACT|nr:type IX secretion system membrane protein PorP/SprF [Fulvivirga sediminis]MBL3657313.1 type IX secretion system membrane protein PorP/SprF [Fulvivirga sediminis]